MRVRVQVHEQLRALSQDGRVRTDVVAGQQELDLVARLRSLDGVELELGERLADCDGTHSRLAQDEVAEPSKNLSLG
jgi:hypothetical protein